MALCRRTFKLKGNKKFRTWTEKSLRVFRISRFLCSIFMDIRCTFPTLPYHGYGTHIYIKIQSYFYSSTVTLVCRRREVEESLHIQRCCRGSEQLAETQLQPKFLISCRLKTPTRVTWPRLFTHAMLLFIGPGLHPRNACSPLVTAYTHAFLTSWILRHTFLFFQESLCWFYIYDRMNRSTSFARLTAGQGNILHKLLFLIQMI